MALQFIFGGSGSGKTHHLYKTIIEESVKYPERNYMVLVPEQFTMQTQKDLVLMHEKKGIMNIDVLSFGRLAHRIFEETGKGNVPVLDDEGKNLVLRKIAKNFEPELKVLKGNMKKLGYISEVKSVISEFTQYDIGAEELDCIMGNVGEESYFYYKLQDIRTIYEGFQEYLKEKYITKEEILDVLCSVVKESKILKNSVVVLDGFTGFTPVQNRLLTELLKLCRDVIITVTIDDRENPYIYQHPYQLFGMSKQTVASLVRIAKTERIEVKEPVCLIERPYYRFKDEPALGFLEQTLFRYSKEVYKAEQNAVTLHEAKNPKEEAYAAAGEVRRLVRTEGIKYREIGVIVSDMNTYGEYLEQAFSKFQIPVFMDHKRSILLNSFVEYLRSIIAMAEQNFTYDSVFRYLRSGYAKFTDEELDDLENYVLALGIKGYKKWQEKWIRKTKTMEDEELIHLNHLRVQIVEEIDALIFVLKQRRKTVRDITEAIYDFLVKEEMQFRLKAQEEAFQAMGEQALAREYAQVYGIVIGLFDKFVALLGDEPVGLKEYAELLDAGLMEAKVGVIPPGPDQVVIGDMERTRLKDIKALLFLGANDTFLPGSLVNRGILSERDREKFAKENLALTPGGKEKAYVQKFYLYLNLTKPTKKLSVYYSKISSDGKSLRPSYLVQELQKLYPAIQLIDESSRHLNEKELAPKTALADLIEGLKMRSDSGQAAWMELYTWYKKNPEWAHKIAAILEAGFYKRPKDKVSETIARELYGEYFERSITRMERYSACAFAHFLTYGLRLKERDVYEFEAFDLGNIFHASLERYSKRLEKEQKDWTDVDADTQKRYVAESVDQAITDYENSVLFSSYRNEHLITRMKRVTERTVWALTEQMARGDFKSYAYEMRFGNGKIDRVDICEDKDEVYVKVVDYKSGTMAFDVSALFHGLQLQLMVYMNAAVNVVKRRFPEKTVVPAGVFYYRIQDPYIERTDADPSLEILKKLRPDGVISLDRESLYHLDHTDYKESLAVPVKKNKDNSLSKYSKAVAADEFNTMLEYAEDKVEKLYGEILEGNVSASPYRMGDRTGCDYCNYRHICGFDTRISDYEYREIMKLSNEEAIAAMRQEMK